MKKILKWIIPVVIVAVAALLVASFWLTQGDSKQPAQTDTEAANTSAAADGQPAQTDASGNPLTYEGGMQPTPAENVEVEITEPKYVYLPTQETDDENLIFAGWETTNGEPSAKYQDVTEIENAVTIPTVYAKAGEPMEAAVRICGQVELCAFDLRVTYDPTLLKYISYSDADADLILNCDAENGVIMMNLLRLTNAEDALDVCKLQFEVLTDLTCETPLEIEVVEAISLDENGEIVFCNYSVVDATVRLNETEG